MAKQITDRMIGAFKAHPSVLHFHFTQDGQAFENLGLARLHAKKNKHTEVPVKVSRAEVYEALRQSSKAEKEKEKEQAQKDVDMKAAKPEKKAAKKATKPKKKAEQKAVEEDDANVPEDVADEGGSDADGESQEAEKGTPEETPDTEKP